MTFERIKSFAPDEAGAVSVDWVVLTAAVVIIGVSAVSVVRDGTNDLGADISASVAVANGD